MARAARPSGTVLPDLRFTGADLSVVFGVSAAQVPALRQRGLIPQPDSSGWYGVDAITAYCDYMRKLAKGKAAHLNGDQNMDEITVDNAIAVRSIEDARLTRAKAAEAELKVDERRGDLVPASMVIELGAGQIGATRAKLLSVHSKVRSRYPDIDQVIVDDIQALHTEALTELAEHGLPDTVRGNLESISESLAAAAEADR